MENRNSIGAWGRLGCLSAGEAVDAAKKEQAAAADPA